MDTGRRTRNFLLLLGAISLLAFSVRIGVSLDLARNDPEVSRPSPGTDMATYMELSRRISEGRIDEPFSYQPFYYAAFLPALHILFGKGIVPVLLAQSLLSAATVLLAGISAAWIVGKRAGIIAGLLCAFSSSLCLYVPYHLIEAMQAFWIAALVFFATAALKRRLALLWFVAGLMLSFSILSRGNMWIFAPGIFLAAIRSGLENGRSKALLFSGAFIVAVIAPQIPFSVWNSAKTGAFCGAAVRGDSVLALGNNPESPPGGVVYSETYRDWSARTEEMGMMGRIVAWAWSEPLAFAELQSRKILLFWDHREIANNVGFGSNGNRSWIWRVFCIVPGSLISAMALAHLAGKALGRRIPRVVAEAENLLIYFVLSYCLATAAFYNLDRYRSGILPVLAVFAGAFADGWIRRLAKWNGGQGKKLGGELPGLLFGIFIVFFAYDAYRAYEPLTMRMVRPHGTRTTLSKGTTMIHDNGPEAFGSWEFAELKVGSRIEKTFDVSGTDHGGEARFLIALFSPGPGTALVEANGLERRIVFEKAGLREEEFQFEQCPDGKVMISINGAGAGLFAWIDRQRDYGRTLIGGKSPGGELACRMYYSPTDK